MSITPDNEVTRLEKRQRGLQRVISAINDLTIYGIYPTNFPKLVKAAEHFKDHVKVEIQATKKRIIELGGTTVEEHFSSLEHVGLINDSGSIDPLTEVIDE